MLMELGVCELCAKVCRALQNLAFGPERIHFWKHDETPPLTPPMHIAYAELHCGSGTASTPPTGRAPQFFTVSLR